jgi:hypothetical protein
MVLTLVSFKISIIALILKSLNDVIFASFLQVGKKSHLNFPLAGWDGTL